MPSPAAFWCEPKHAAPTFSIHEGLQEFSQRARVRVNFGHLVEVVVGDNDVLGVAGHVDYLGTTEAVVEGTGTVPPPYCPAGERGEGQPHSITLQPFSWKEAGRSWTGRWVFTSRGDGVFSSSSMPAGGELSGMCPLL